MTSRAIRHYDVSDPASMERAIVAECEFQGLRLKAQQAYVLATAYWESARSMKPVVEAYWKSEDWRRRNLRYYPWHGRGLVQLTWEKNYARFKALTGIDLTGNPDLALDPDVSIFVLVYGFKQGSFTGKKIEDFIRPGLTDFRHARRCINGMDRASDIAKIAEGYLKTLTQNG